MINLLKRFSSERKLLETRGAFIIRSEPCCPAGASRPGWAGRKGSVPGSLTSPGAGALFGSLPGELAAEAGLSRANRLASRVSRHRNFCSQPPRQSISVLHGVVGFCLGNERASWSTKAVLAQGAKSSQFFHLARLWALQVSVASRGARCSPHKEPALQEPRISAADIGRFCIRFGSCDQAAEAGKTSAAAAGGAAASFMQ